MAIIIVVVIEVEVFAEIVKFIAAAINFHILKATVVIVGVNFDVACCCLVLVSSVKLVLCLCMLKWSSQVLHNLGNAVDVVSNMLDIDVGAKTER